MNQIRAVRWPHSLFDEVWYIPLQKFDQRQTAGALFTLENFNLKIMSSNAMH